MRHLHPNSIPLRITMLWLGCGCLGFCASSRVFAEDLFWGQTTHERLRQVEQGSTNQVRLLAAWSLAQQGLPVAAELMQLSEHPTAAIRYWSVVGLANASLAAQNNPGQKEKILVRLTTLTLDSDPSVSIVACESLVRLQEWERALPPLERWLEDERETIRYRAIAVLDRPLPENKIPYSLIRKIYPQLGEYSQRVANRLLSAQRP